MKITIDTHHSSREEVKDLEEYLEDNSWDFKKKKLSQIQSILFQKIVSTELDSMMKYWTKDSTKL